MKYSTLGRDDVTLYDKNMNEIKKGNIFRRKGTGMFYLETLDGKVIRLKPEEVRAIHSTIDGGISWLA